MGERIVRQLCRELLLLQSSDWQFLITTGAARDYAEQRFSTHAEQFAELVELWQQLQTQGELGGGQGDRLAQIEARDSLFAGIDPRFWAQGARDTAAAASLQPALAAGKVATHSTPATDDASLSQLQKFLPSAEA